MREFIFLMWYWGWVLWKYTGMISQTRGNYEGLGPLFRKKGTLLGPKWNHKSLAAANKVYIAFAESMHMQLS